MQLFLDKKECCGCGACMEICPKSAITMTEDEFGFLYPEINKEYCIECGLCKNICVFTRRTGEKTEPISAYAAAAKDQEVLSKSTSGGIFAELAKYVINIGGAVYGCAYNENFDAEHIEIKDVADLKKLQGSKYVQSNTCGTFKNVEARLKAGETVLYSGTPCQIAALRGFLKKDYENLYLVDIICHGVGAPKLFKDDLKYLCDGRMPKEVNFRDKSKGWGTHGCVKTENHNLKYTVLKSPYYYYYLGSAVYRDSCYNCRYPKETRPGDITVGDYWKIESAHPDIEQSIDTKKGISCVLVNTAKGGELISAIKENITLVESDYEKISKRNGQLVDCSKKPKARDDIFEAYNNGGYGAVAKYWKTKAIKNRLKIRIKSIIPKDLKKYIKKFI